MQNDAVNNPSHYEVLKDIDAVTIIKATLDGLKDRLTPYDAYCLGNILKYRLRAGNKDNLEQDIGKANKYKELAESELLFE